MHGFRAEVYAFIKQRESYTLWAQVVKEIAYGKQAIQYLCIKGVILTIMWLSDRGMDKEVFR